MLGILSNRFLEDSVCGMIAAMRAGWVGLSGRFRVVRCPALMHIKPVISCQVRPRSTTYQQPTSNSNNQNAPKTPSPPPPGSIPSRPRPSQTLRLRHKHHLQCILVRPPRRLPPNLPPPHPLQRHAHDNRCLERVVGPWILSCAGGY